jgi:hypothetical protein
MTLSPTGESLSTTAADWGYSQTGASTLGFLRKIERANGDGVLTSLTAPSISGEDHFGIRERYKSLIRQLPAKVYIDKLVDVYFKEFNWQYYPLDQDLFLEQLTEWNKLPFNIFSTMGPQALTPDMRVFPALLFQVLACALLILPAGSEEAFESLKYAGNMTFEDLSVDYSESGMAVLSLLGKRQITLTTVQAGFMRAAVLKYMAKVTESVSPLYFFSTSSPLRCFNLGWILIFLHVVARNRDCDQGRPGDWDAPRQSRPSACQQQHREHVGEHVADPTEAAALHDSNDLGHAHGGCPRSPWEHRLAHPPAQSPN